MERQASTLSTTQILASAAAVLPNSTVVPIREEIRVRRLWFFYHDIRAFASSWLHPIIFSIYRVVVFCYLFAWLIASLVSRSNEGGKWLIFISNQAYLLLLICCGSFAVFNIVYTVVHYRSPHRLVKFYPHEDTPKSKIYAQDNVAFYVKMLWMMYIIAATMSLCIVLGYWVLIYDSGSCIPRSEYLVLLDEFLANSTNATSLPNACIDGVSLHSHGINFILVLIDVFLSRIPFQLLHFMYPPIFTTLYIIFAAIYTVAGGTNEVNNPYIYSALDYINSPARATGLSIALIILPAIVYFPFFFVAWLRDVIYQKFGRFFFRDIRLSDQQYDETDAPGTNGVAQEAPKESNINDKDIELSSV